MRLRLLSPIGAARSGLALALLILGAAAAFAQSPSWYWQRGPADLVLRHGHVVTVDAAHPEAQAVAVSAGKILAVGSDEAIQRYIGPHTQVIDLNGRLLIPGFIDAHAHFMGMGEALKELDLTKAHTWDDIVRMVADAVKTAKPGQWIQGRGWHQAKWDHAPEPNVEGLPYNDSLSRVSPDNPVILTHASGHAIFVNQKAMALAGIGPKTPNPPGGEIVRDAKGRAIGMLRDRAMTLVRRVLQAQLDQRTPAQVQADLEETVRLAAHDMLSKGVTTASDEGESFKTIDFLKKLVGEGKVPARLWVLVSGESPAALAAKLPQYWLDGYGDDHLSVRGIGEITADGALGTHSAWFLKPYDDLPTSTGLSVTPPATIKAMAEIALKDHFQVSVHAIGDRANHEVLNVFQQIFAAHPDARDLRWRIEHAQHLEASDIPRFGQMHVIASMQSIHACSDGPYVIQRLGEARAAEGAYAWRKLIDAGAIIANGTDAPVEDIDPIPNFDCAVTRRMKNGQAFFPQEDMTREEALRSYTINAAYAIFQEDRLGSITPGKLADLVVLSKDIMTVPADQISSARVDDTLVGGQIVYQRMP
ncbi:MAG TPA: amidohydrolase [Vicinamibacterales bacterium]|nr:amidohydrolase [Vicinamibacterales bacterium]